MIKFSTIFEQWISSYYKYAKIGKEGDFYTSVSASKFFGGGIAKYIIDKLEDSTLSLPINIIDIGGNNLSLLSDIYEFLRVLSIGVAENCNFILVESNADINSIDITCDFNIHIVNDVNSIQHITIDTIFIANEFFDSLPCDLFTNNKILYVSENLKNYEFCSANYDITKIVRNNGFKTGEVPISYFKFTSSLNSVISNSCKWFFLVFDYGDRFFTNTFNIRMFSKHNTIPLFNNIKMISNLDNYFKKCDITYNVPFSILDKAFSNINAQCILFKRQDVAFIENFNILKLLEDFYISFNKCNNNLYIREVNKVKTLLNMGEKFKVAIYTNF